MFKYVFLEKYGKDDADNMSITHVCFTHDTRIASMEIMTLD